MFKYIFNFFINSTDKTSLISKLNTWLFINVKSFKLKISNNLFFFINSIHNFKLLSLKTFFKSFSFDLFYFKFFFFFFFFFFVSKIFWNFYNFINPSGHYYFIFFYFKSWNTGLFFYFLAFFFFY